MAFLSDEGGSVLYGGVASRRPYGRLFRREEATGGQNGRGGDGEALRDSIALPVPAQRGPSREGGHTADLASRVPAWRGSLSTFRV